MSPATKALGPGLRAAVWVQGCLKNCPGCISPEWSEHKPAHLIQSDILAEQLLAHPEVSGFTFSGGEPMLQAAGLAEVIMLARRKKSLNLICYTGYTLEHLQSSPPSAGVDDLLAETDVLIDGDYQEDLNDDLGLRGSSNQYIHFLTDRLSSFDFENAKRSVEIEIGDGFTFLKGIPTRAALRGYNQATAPRNSVG